MAINLLPVLSNSLYIITVCYIYCIILQYNVDFFRDISFLYGLDNQYPADKTFVKHLYNVGPTFLTLVQHCMNIIQMFCVYLV